MVNLSDLNYVFLSPKAVPKLPETKIQVGTVEYIAKRKCDEVAAAAAEKTRIDDAMALVAEEKARAAARAK